MADTFIKCRTENLPEEQARNLQIWLSKPEAGILRGVIESSIRSEMAEVANAALLALNGAPLKMELSNEHLIQARKLADVLALLDKIRNSQVPFHITKWI